MARTVEELRRAQERMAAQQRRAVTTTRTRTDDRAGGGGTGVTWAVVRYVTAGAECWAQEVRYSDDEPIEGAVEAVGGWFKVHPIPGGLYESFAAFAVPAFTASNRVIRNADEYDAATVEGSTDPLNPMALNPGNLIPVKVYESGGVRIAEVALKLPRNVGIVHPLNILPGGSSV